MHQRMQKLICRGHKVKKKAHLLEGQGEELPSGLACSGDVHDVDEQVLKHDGNPISRELRDEVSKNIGENYLVDKPEKRKANKDKPIDDRADD